MRCAFLAVRIRRGDGGLGSNTVPSNGHRIPRPLRSFKGRARRRGVSFQRRGLRSDPRENGRISRLCWNRCNGVYWIRNGDWRRREISERCRYLALVRDAFRYKTGKRFRSRRRGLRGCARFARRDLARVRRLSHYRLPENASWR